MKGGRTGHTDRFYGENAFVTRIPIVFTGASILIEFHLNIPQKSIQICRSSDALTWIQFPTISFKSN